MNDLLFYTDIPGYEGRYRINQRGDIQRVYKTKKVPMKPSIKKGEYVIRLLKPCGHRKEERVHKLMELTYMPPAPPGKVLYHKNGVKTDNWINNLAHISRHELGKKTGAKSRRKPVLKLDHDGEIVETYTSAREAGKANFMSYQTIIDRCNGKVKSKFAPDGYQYIWDEDYEY